MQYRIAICDDINFYIDIIKSYAEEYAKQISAQIEVAVFTEGEALIASDTAKHFDIIFLDIEMPGMDGITIGKKLREENPDVVLVYITIHDSFSMDAANLEAMYYIVKPIDHDKMFRVLHNAMTLIRGRQAEQLIQKRFIEVISDYKTIPLELTKIVYMIKSQNRLTIRMMDGIEYVTYDTVKKMMTKLPKNLFFQVSGCLIVNLYYVKSMKAYQLTIGVKNWREIHPVSRLYYKKLKKDYLIFQKRLTSRTL
ncbi:LytR/AlgR family response regulator transcription factor [Anaerolentibacter hominis]|uniref:LytR/AlgR family response regulator transcription factor n=1 Tax=Anaerolentibacter hominis TaxID=3079009 RepID=UPI0031B89951